MTYSAAEYAYAVSAGLVSPEIDAALQAAMDDQVARAVASLNGAKAQLDSYNDFYSGLVSYTNGVASAANGCASLVTGLNQLNDGSAALVNGLTTLNDGILTLKSGSATLIDGVTQLRDGSRTLADGMQQFYDDGISKLVNSISIADLQDVLDRLQIIGEAGSDYNNFSGISDGMEGTVRFIYKTDSIG